MPLFFIEPTNEGQDLNYSETFEGTFKGAKKRALKMKASLQRILKQGSIGVSVKNQNYEEVYYK